MRAKRLPYGNQFHVFCERKLISLDTEYKFVQFYKDLMRKHFIVDDRLLDFMIHNLSQESIGHFWKQFVTDWQRKILKQENELKLY